MTDIGIDKDNNKKEEGGQVVAQEEIANQGVKKNAAGKINLNPEIANKKFKLKLSLWIIFTSFILDQISKYYIFSIIESEYHYIKVNSFFNLVKVWNTGVSFGMFKNLMNGDIILSLVTMAITGILLCWLVKSKHLLTIISTSLIISGAFGNLTDRLIHGAVMDFLDVHIGSYHWPAFNIADSAVSIGVFIMLIEMLFYNPDSQKSQEEQGLQDKKGLEEKQESNGNNQVQDGKVQDSKVQDSKVQDGKVQDGKVQDGQTHDNIVEQKIENGKSEA